MGHDGPRDRFLGNWVHRLSLFFSLSWGTATGEDSSESLTPPRSLAHSFVPMETRVITLLSIDGMGQDRMDGMGERILSHVFMTRMKSTDK
jgi:hypothetical protein